MGRPYIIHPDKHQEVIELYQTGNYTMSELARMFGATNRQPVKTILEKHGISGNDQRQIQGNDLDTIQKLYDSGMSKYAIALEMDVSQKAVTTAMKDSVLIMSRKQENTLSMNISLM